MMKYSKIQGASYSLDYSKLRGKIVECFGKQALFALAMGLSERTVSLKLNNIRCWTQQEIIQACEVLMIPTAEISNYFFTQKPQD